MNRRISVSVFVFVVAVSAFAQDGPKVQAFGGYSFGHLAPCGTAGGDCAVQGSESPQHGAFNGWNAAATYFVWKGLGATADFSGYYGTVHFTSDVKVSSQTYNFLFGPTWVFRVGHLSPFVHGLGGTSILHRGPTQMAFNGQNGNGLTWGVGAGLDLSMKSDESRRRQLLLRLGQFDYLRMHIPQDFVPSAYSNGVRYSAGVVASF